MSTIVPHISVKSVHVVFEICEQTDIHTDTFIAIPRTPAAGRGGEVTNAEFPATAASQSY